jgi:hypothetical protein
MAETKTAPTKTAATKKAAPERQENRVGDAAVRARTGKGWDEWIAILDAEGAQSLGHKEIVAIVDRHLPGNDGWWPQMVTVGYEQARGLRVKHQKPEGFEISRSKTIQAPAARLYAAWTEPALLAQWFGQETAAAVTMRKCTPDKSARLLWSDGHTTVEALFYPKGEQRTQVALQHSKLASAEQADDMKAYWGEKLDILKSLLEE